MKNINYKLLYRIFRQYAYNRNIEAMRILYNEWEEPSFIILLMQEYPYFMNYEK